MPTAVLIHKRDVIRHFAARLDFARHDLGLTQRILAERARIEQGVISRLERGHTDVKFPTLHRLAYGLGTPVTWLAELAEPSEFEPIPPNAYAAEQAFDRDGLAIDFASRCRTAREALGLFQFEVAERAGTWKRTVTGYELAEKLPHLTAAHHLADALDVPVGWLLEGGASPWPS